MEYAVILYFDRETEDRIGGLIRRLADNGVNPYMIDHRIPAHITLSMFEKEDSAGLMEMVECFSKDLHRFDVHLASIGIFNPEVIFLAPVMTADLSAANRHVYICVSSHIAVMNGRYVPGQWVPHVSLGIRMAGQELFRAFETVQKEFTAFFGAVTQIALVECDPYVELYRYDLSS